MLMWLDEVGDHVAQHIADVVVVDRVGNMSPLPGRPHDPSGPQQAQVVRGQRLGQPKRLPDLPDPPCLV